MSGIKEAYVAQELKGILGYANVRNVSIRAKRENWPSRPRSGQGGGFEYPTITLPADVREAIALAVSAEERESLPVVLESATPAVPQDSVVSLAHLSSRERDVVLSRKVFIDAVYNFEMAGHTRRTAIITLVEGCKNGTLPQNLMDAAYVANARRGSSRGISITRLYGWCSTYETKGILGLVPINPQKDMTPPAWLHVFLQLWQKPQKPSVQQSYNEFVTLIKWVGAGMPEGTVLLSALPGKEIARKPHNSGILKELAEHPENVPSVHAVRRWLDKIPEKERMHGRATGNAFRKFCAYKRRSTENMLPVEGFTGDGTTLDAMFYHPYQKRAFKPEITLILDIATRKCVGSSVDTSENGLTVLDALRAACVSYGIPQFFYTDNGPGYKNAMLTKEGTGILTQLGIVARHSIPSVPQGKGLMEIAVKTICTPLSKRFDSCTHRDMDSDAARKFYLLTRKEIEKTAKSDKLPTLDQLLAALQYRIEEYNATPHTSLPKFTDANGKRRNYSPNEYWEMKLAENPDYEILAVPSTVRDELFMPTKECPVKNCRFKLAGREYYAKELDLFHGEKVNVRYDMRDPKRVTVWTLDMEMICEAFLDGNSIEYMVLSEQEQREAQKMRDAIGRIEKRAQKLVPGATIVCPDGSNTAPATATVVNSIRRPIGPVVDVQPLPEAGADWPDEAADSLTESVAPRTAEPRFEFPYEKYEHYMLHPELWTPEITEWMEWYVQTEEYADYEPIFASKGLAWEKKICAKCS